LEATNGPQHIVVVCSTTGNGDPPDNCAKFWRYLKRRTQPTDMLASVSYTVLGLGDTNYDKFCYMGKSLDKRMSELGAQRFYDMCTFQSVPYI
jgi:methionine synthase reductase